MTGVTVVFLIILCGKARPGLSPTPCLMPVVGWQCVVAVLEGALYLREYSSDLGGAYLCKTKTAEYEFGSNTPEVYFDTSQAGSQYLRVTFWHHFVTVWTVVILHYNPVDQFVRIPSVMTRVVFRKTVFEELGESQAPGQSLMPLTGLFFIPNSFCSGSIPS
jgi:hypothetical protein